MLNQVKRRVVITGLGLISPLGNSPHDLWEALSKAQSGIARLTSVPADEYSCPFGGEARRFTGRIDDFGPLEGDLKKTIRKGLKLMCREIEMGVAAAQMALHDSGLRVGLYDPERTGVSYGSDYIMTPPEEFIDAVRVCRENSPSFDFDRWGPQGMSKIAPLWLLKYLPNMPASHIAIYNDFRGPSNSITQREASSHLAIGEDYATIVRGHSDVMIAGATGTRVHCVRTIHITLQEQIAQGEDPEKLSRPFDLNRTGMVLGEGAGALVLEELESARSRGATILAEIVGHGSSSAANGMGVADCRTSIRNALAQALRSSGWTVADVGHVDAHGLATTKIDKEEAAAIADVFGSRSESIPVTAAKSYFGNLGAGSGSVELIGNILSLLRGELFRTLNYQTRDPECPVAVVHEAGMPAGKGFIGINVTPQGQASTIAVRRFE